jgi:very-short-patch-repair endonuclease
VEEYYPNDEMYYGASKRLMAFARQLRVMETEAEKALWLRINKKQLNGLRFRRQHPIVYFVADFYCPQAKLVIEVDGGIHKQYAQFEYDRARDQELIVHGLTVLRFTNEEVLTDIDTVVRKILDAAKVPLGFPINHQFKPKGI